MGVAGLAPEARTAPLPPVATRSPLYVCVCVMGVEFLQDDTNRARAFSLMPLVWGLGSTIAPMAGGMVSGDYPFSLVEQPL